MTNTTLSRAMQAMGTGLRPAGAPLSTSSRSQVVRALTDDGRSVIVKRYLEPHPVGEAREASALAALASDSSACAPRIVAEGDGLLVVEDLGMRDSLADVLLGGSRRAARDGVHAWAAGLGRFHVAGMAAAGAFRSEMLRRTGACTDYMATEFEEAANSWHGAASEFGLAASEANFGELARLPGRFSTDLQVLSPGDTCPDNNVLLDGHAVMIDLEFATVRHAAWDVAYLHVPWPTCWCGWTLPGVVAREAQDVWQAHASPLLTNVDDSALQLDVRLAADGWRWLSSYRLLRRLLAPRRQTRVGQPSPRHQDRIVHWLQGAADSPLLPTLGNAARHLGAAIAERFGAVPLKYPRAFS